MTSTAHRPSRGTIFLLALIIGAVILTVSTGFFNYFGAVIHSERSSLAGSQALAIAEAGIDKAVYELNQSSSYSGESNTALGNGAFSVSVASINGNTKRLTVTGVVPNTASPAATKTIQVTVSINSSVVSFRYGIQAGDGGVSMSNGASIIGNLFSNGNVTGSGTITGDATVAVGTDPTANQQWSVQNASFNLGDTTAHASVAQAFKPSVTASLSGVKLFLKKLGSPGDISIKIVTDNAGKPSTTVLASGTIPSSLVTTAYSFIDATLTSTPSLTTNQTYWIIAIASVNANNYFIWGRDSNGGYTQGSAKYSSNWNAQNPVWTSITGDLDFMTYVVGIATSLSGVTVQGNAWAASLANCTVGGSASYQTITSCNVTGAQNPNTVPSAPTPLPISDAQIADWEAIALAGGTIAGPYAPSGTVTLGPKKINGDLSIQNGATLILTGPLWVNGNVLFSNNATLRVSSSAGSNGAVIIADAVGNTAVKGTVVLSNNVTISGNGSANSFPMIISTNTGTHAVDLSNNASSVILYAPYGSVDIENGASANQVTARKLELENNSSITYVNGLQNASFSNGPGGSWTVVPGSYAIVQ